MLEPRELDAGDQHQRIRSKTERRELGDANKVRDRGVARGIRRAVWAQRRPQLEPDRVGAVTRPALDRRVREQPRDVPTRSARLMKLPPTIAAEREHGLSYPTKRSWCPPAED